jgi:hypothetical protein
VPIAGSTATVAGLRLTAENLAGRRNRISTVSVRRVRGGSSRSKSDGGPEPSAGAGAPGDEPGDEAVARLAWAADDLPGGPAAEIGERAAELEDG